MSLADLPARYQIHDIWVNIPSVEGTRKGVGSGFSPSLRQVIDSLNA